MYADYKSDYDVFALTVIGFVVLAFLLSARSPLSSRQQSTFKLLAVVVSAFWLGAILPLANWRGQISMFGHWTVHVTAVFGALFSVDLMRSTSGKRRAAAGAALVFFGGWILVYGYRTFVYALE